MDALGAHLNQEDVMGVHCLMQLLLIANSSVWINYWHIDASTTFII